MATTAINKDNPSLLDIATETDPQGRLFNVVKQLTPRTAFLPDAAWKEGNLATGHVFASETALPSVGWRRFNEGNTPSKGRTDQVTETCGMLTGQSVVDVKLAQLNGNQAAYRDSQNKRFIRALSKEADTAFVYHSTHTTPEKIHGLAPRFNKTTDPGGKQIFLHTGSPSGSDQASMWLVVWHPETVCAIYPRGSMMGLEHKDMGEVMWDDGTGKFFRAYVSDWSWQFGLAVMDWRFVVRIANIDTSALAGSNDDLIPKMIEGHHQIEDISAGRAAWYANRKIHTFLHLQARNAVKNSTLKVEEVEGKPVVSFMGVPVRISDALTNTESILS